MVTNLIFSLGIFFTKRSWQTLKGIMITQYFVLFSQYVNCSSKITHLKRIIIVTVK